MEGSQGRVSSASRCKLCCVDQNLVGNFEPPTKELTSKDNFAGLKQRPLHWTVGGLTDRDGIFKPNFEIADTIGLDINTDCLMCGHFPQVKIPEKLAEWIVDCFGKTPA